MGAKKKLVEMNLDEYIESKLYRLGCPSWLALRELDVLMRIVPGPLGLGMSTKMTAISLGVAESTIWRINKGLAEKFPTAWERVQSMRGVMNRQRHGLKYPHTLDRGIGRTAVENE